MMMIMMMIFVFTFLYNTRALFFFISVQYKGFVCYFLQILEQFVSFMSKFELNAASSRCSINCLGCSFKSLI
jgi:hypothetical protein